jgi:hypothetical protein
VWLKIVWQTGATSEHHVQRRVHTYRNYIDIDRLRQRKDCDDNRMGGLVRYRVTGMDCLSCASRIETTTRAMPVCRRRACRSPLRR